MNFKLQVDEQLKPKDEQLQKPPTTKNIKIMPRSVNSVASRKREKKY